MVCEPFLIKAGIETSATRAWKRKETFQGEYSMAISILRTIMKQVKNMPPEEQRELRAFLDTLLVPAAPAAEEEFERAMTAAGLISVPSPETRARAARRQRRPVPVRGKPVSETLIEDRR